MSEAPISQLWRRAKWWISGPIIASNTAASDSFPTAASAPGCAGWKFRINTTRWEECAPILRPTDLRAETGVSTNYEPKHAENISGVGQDGQPRQSGFLAHGGKARRSLGGSQPGAGIR